MFIQCKSCQSKLSWNHKVHRPLRELACPHCGGSFERAPVSWRDPLGRHEQMVWRFQDAVKRLEDALRLASEIAPTFGEIGRLINNIRLPQLDADDGESGVAARDPVSQ